MTVTNIICSICSPHPRQQRWHRAKRGVAGSAFTNHGKKGALR